MFNPTRILYEIAGSPSVESCGDATGRCYVCCSEMTRGMPVAKWLGSNYTDQNRARWPSATHVCEACCHIHAWTSPPGREPEPGKKRGANWRMFSHLWEDGWGYRNANKADKPTIREFIEREHGGDWFAALADTGQKHVIPFTPINGRGRSGLVLMDELRVQVPSDTTLIAKMTDLLTRGATKAGIETGRHNAGAYERLGSDLLRFERYEARFRGGGWFTLALWLAQRDEEEVQRRMAAEKEAKKNARRSKKRAAQDVDGGAGASGTRGVPTKRARKRAEALGAAGDEAQGSSSDVLEPRGTGDTVRAKPAAGGPQQGRLPGFE